jgi:hypothetical protein
MHFEVDILENEILEKYPEAFKKLLLDHTTQKNILWATDNYENLGAGYGYASTVEQELITGENGHVIMPRVQKTKTLQESRSKEMAEVFTPSWICNAQNNLIDNEWFGRKNVFNIELVSDEGVKTWKVSKGNISFPTDGTWKDYIRDTRLEMACGEAPYITSRYDTTTGEFIPVGNRIGILDRKLRVINENVDTSGDWLKAAQVAYKNTYAFEWQGDNLLLAREAMLIAFIENYYQKFGERPKRKSIEFMAYIISWNVWQMDGLKAVIPESCKEKARARIDLFGKPERKECEGCADNSIYQHIGIYSLIKDWRKRDPDTKRAGLKIKYVDLSKKN